MTTEATNKFLPEVRERAVRMVQEHTSEHPTHWAAVQSVAAEIGCAAQTLHDWTRKAEVDGGKRAGVPTEVAERLRVLERENREPRQSHEALRQVWHQLRREGVLVARCTVARLMHDIGLAGVIRGKPVRTTVGDKAAPCPLDRVNRQFRVPAPNMLIGVASPFLPPGDRLWRWCRTTRT